jgi:hypothetical protein
MPNSPAQSQALGQALRRYLHEHPRAADSVTGIREWWLPESLRSVGLEDLRVVLLELVAAGEAACQRLPDGSELFAATGAAAPTADPSP